MGDIFYFVHLCRDRLNSYLHRAMNQHVSMSDYWFRIKSQHKSILNTDNQTSSLIHSINERFNETHNFCDNSF